MFLQVLLRVKSQFIKGNHSENSQGANTAVDFGNNTHFSKSLNDMQTLGDKCSDLNE